MPQNHHQDNTYTSLTSNTYKETAWRTGKMLLIGMGVGIGLTICFLAGGFATIIAIILIGLTLVVGGGYYIKSLICAPALSTRAEVNQNTSSQSQEICLNNPEETSAQSHFYNPLDLAYSKNPDRAATIRPNLI